MKNSLALFVLSLLFLCNHSWGNALFKDPYVELIYSDSLLEKNARNDSLLPRFDGEEAMRQLMEKVPDLWSVGDLGVGYEVVTQLKVKITFVDGTREEAFCEVNSNFSDRQFVPTEWTLNMGVDFISGGSNTVEDHVRLCIQEARESFGLAVRNRLGEIEFLTSKKEDKQLDLYRVNAEMSDKNRMKVMATTKYVEKNHECPKDIQSYRMLLDVFEQVKGSGADIYQINEELNEERNGGNTIQSCAYSREWNQRYSERFELACDVDENECKIWQSEDGTKNWILHEGEENLFKYQSKNLFGGGKQSIHDGGKVMDLLLIPLSRKIYLEAYLNKKKEPVSLGLLVIDANE